MEKDEIPDIVEEQRQAAKLEEFKNHLFQSIMDTAPTVLEAMNNRNKELARELLAQFFVDNLDILNKIKITRKNQDTRFDREQLDAIKTNLTNLMK